MNSDITITYNDPIVYDDIPLDNNALLDDVFGVDDDTKEPSEKLATADSNLDNTTDEVNNIDPSFIPPVELRRSPRINSGDVFLQYMCTDDMIADILNKSVDRKPFKVLRDKLLNWYA